MVEMKKSLEISSIDNAHRIIIQSFGPMYPDEKEFYLRDLQSNLLIISSSNIQLEYKNPIFLKSELESFVKQLDLLVQRKVKKANLYADEEEINLVVQRKSEELKVTFEFKQNNFVNEKWGYTIFFSVSEESIKKIITETKIP